MINTPTWQQTSVGFVSIFAFFCGAVLFIIWTNHYLPMVDMAQHAGILHLWLNYHDPAYNYEDIYRFNWSTPYLLANLLAYGFGKFFGVTAAIKMTLSVALLGLPFALLLLLRQSGGDPWWSVLAFPLGFGFSFYAGLIPYLMALPIAILHLIMTVRLARFPTIHNAVLLALIGVILFYAHVIALAPCLVVMVVVYLERNRDIGSLRLLLLPVLSVIPPIIFWIATSTGGTTTNITFTWDLSAGRPLSIVACLMGMIESFDVVGRIGIFTLIFFVAFRPRLRKNSSAWMPFITMSLFVLLCPNGFMDAFYIYQRLAILIVPAFFYGIAPGNLTPRKTAAARAIIVMAASYALGHLQQRFHQFDREARSFDQVLACMEPRKRLVSLIHADTSTKASGRFHYRHFPAWYQVEKGGVISYSFSQQKPSLIRSKNITKAEMAATWKLHLNPRSFEWKNFADYDYYLLRTRDARDVADFAQEAGAQVKLLCQAKEWYLYQNNTSSIQQ